VIVAAMDDALEAREPPAGAPWGLRDMIVAGLATIGLV